MTRTPETIARHELNGLPVRVVESDDASRVGIEGRVVIETTNTLSIEVCASSAAETTGEDESTCRDETQSRVVSVPKAGTVFEFTITDDAADAGRQRLAPPSTSVRGSTKGSGTTSEPAGEDVAYVTVDGSRLLSRPARRTETNGDSPWQ